MSTNTIEMKKIIAILFLIVCVEMILSGFTTEPKKNHIKWVDFNVSYEVLDHAYKTVPNQIPDLLAYVTLKNGNNFKSITQDLKVLNSAIKDLSIVDKYRENKYFKYYLESYRVILGGVIDFETGTLNGFHPFAKGFWYSCYDDFGNSRGYGFKRRHLGHDMFGSTGAPIIAVESGTVTELGWNQYGGWRIGIRSESTPKNSSEEFSQGKSTEETVGNTFKYPARYYYYAHLRKDRPFAANIQKGDTVTAGQVIGYLGNTGYSRRENTNMKKGKPHLHFGIQIIFDSTQEDGNGEIWIDCHTLCRFLSRNRARVQKNTDTGEWLANGF